MVMLSYYYGWWWWQYSNNTTTNNGGGSSQHQLRYGTRVLHRTVQGRSIPLLGHAITFLLYPPWDLLTLWHQRRYDDDDDDDAASPPPVLQEDSSTPPSSNLPQQEPIICFPLMGNTIFSIASPIYCKYILQSKIAHVQKDITNTMKPFLSILGTGIVSSDGSHWLQQRLKMSHPLRQDILQIIPYQTLVAVQRLLAILDNAAADPNNNNNSVPIGSLLRHLTLQVISSSFLSLSHHESDETFAKLYLPIVDECNQRVWHPYRAYLFLLPSFWIFQYHVYRLNHYVSTLIRQRWKLRCEERRGSGDNSDVASETESSTPSNNGTTIQQQQQQPHHHHRPPPPPRRRQDILDKILLVYETNVGDNTDAKTNSTTLPESIVKQVRDELKTFMLAGHETSAALMTWTIYELLLDQEFVVDQEFHPETDQGRSTRDTSTAKTNTTTTTLLEKIRLEANQVFDPNLDWRTATEQDLPPHHSHNVGSSSSSSSSSSLQHLMLTEACLKETLRKYSVVPIAARRVVQDLYLPPPQHPVDSATNASLVPSVDEPPYFLPKGSTVLINIQAVHLDPNIWPQPMQYDPYRFLLVEPSNGDTSDPDSPTCSLTWKNIEPYTFLPFIAGPRNCLGQHLALLETKMVVALLFQRYDFTLPEDMRTLMTTHWSQTKTPNATATTNTVATSWRDASIIDPRHRYMVPIIPKKEIMLRVSRKKPAHNSCN